MDQKMNRKQIQSGTKKEIDKSDKEYWAKADVGEKVQTITYLRECFYGPEATTGRLQRFYTVFKQA